MTLAEKIAHIAKDDPKFARSVKRLRMASWLFGLGALLALAFSIWAVAVNFFQSADITNVHNDVTRIQKTPCSRHPAQPSQACEELRQALAASESIVAECIAHQRVEGTRGRNCKRFYVDVDLGGAPELQHQGGDAHQTGSTGHQQPSPSPSGGGGSGTEAGKGGGHVAPAPGSGGGGGPSPAADGGRAPAAAPASGGSGGQQSSAPPPPPASEAADSEPHPLPEAVEAAGGAVGETGEAAQGVVEGTGKAAGCVLRGSC